MNGTADPSVDLDCVANSVALNVESDRIALPPSAGLCKPWEFLDARRSDIVQNLQQIVVPNDRIESKLPQPCHRVTRDQEITTTSSSCRGGNGDSDRGR